MLAVHHWIAPAICLNPIKSLRITHNVGWWEWVFVQVGNDCPTLIHSQKTIL